SPSRFVSSGGSIVEEAYATDKWKYQHTMRGWMKPVDFLLAYNAGYTVYQSAIVARPSTITKYAACLKKLVPLWQQAIVDYVRNPKPVNNELLKIVKEFASYWTLTPGGEADAVKTMKQLKIVGNGSNRTLGDFDLRRVQDVINRFVPIFTKQHIQT